MKQESKSQKNNKRKKKDFLPGITMGEFLGSVQRAIADGRVKRALEIGSCIPYDEIPY